MYKSYMKNVLSLHLDDPIVGQTLFLAPHLLMGLRMILRVLKHI